MLAAAIAAGVAAVAGAGGWLGRPWMLLAATAAAAVVAAAVGVSGAAGGPSRRLAAGALGLALVAGAVLPAPVTDWDALTYHLYLPATWVQEGARSQLPTVFGDNAAAFAPKSVSLLHAWALGLSGYEAPSRLLSPLFLALIVAATDRLGRLLGATRQAAGSVAVGALLLPAILRLATAPGADLVVAGTFAWALAVALETGRGAERRRVFAASAAAGLAAGAKTVGLPLALIPLSVAGWAMRRRGRRRAVVGMGAAFLAAGGWWYLEAAARWGNPLFPLDVPTPLGRLAGVYDRAAVAAGEFHAASLTAALAALGGWLGLGTVVVAVAGAVGLSLPRPGPRRRVRATLGVIAVLWLLFFLLVVPHNLESRFALPALLCLLPGLALVLDRVPERRWWLVGGTALLALAPPLVELARRHGGLLGGWRLSAGAVLCGVVLVLALAALGAAGWRRAALAALGGAVAVGVVAWGQATAVPLRAAALARADFAPWAPLVVELDRLCEGRPDRPPLVAYSGANVPYALVGPELGRRVRYCNVQGGPEDGLYEQWQRAPGLQSYHKPALYRGSERYGEWRRNLEAFGAEWLVVFALHPAERRTIATDEAGLPVEDRWAREHPELFTPLVRLPAGTIYRVSRRDDGQGTINPSDPSSVAARAAIPNPK